MSFPAVMAGVIVMGDQFGFINGVGLVIIIVGVLLYHWHKYRRVRYSDVAAGRQAGKDHSLNGSAASATLPRSSSSTGGGTIGDVGLQAYNSGVRERIENAEYEPLLPTKTDTALSNG